MANLCGSALCLILREATTVLGDPAVNPLARRAHEEALAIAAAHGVMLDDSPDVRYGLKRVHFDHRPSILQDYDLGRSMEIDAIVRAPVAFARSAGVATPTLDASRHSASRLPRRRACTRPDFFITVRVNRVSVRASLRRCFEFN
jgi:2-dehydropantoate 2-reductase